METDWVGVPEITPVLSFSINPFGNEPNVTEYVTDSPVMEGLAEKEVPFVSVYVDWGYEKDVIGARTLKVNVVV